MQARAEGKFIRIAPRKIRLLVSLIRGMHVTAAQAQLKFSPKNSATPILKVLNSAIANAKNNDQADVKDFYVLECFVNEGPKIKRFAPKAQGRATPIRLRMSHVTIIVGDKVVKHGTKAKAARAAKAAAKLAQGAPVEKKAVAKAVKTTKAATKKTK